MTAARVPSLPLSRAAVELFQHGGEMGERMRAVDWSQTPLGPVAQWPHSLKACVRIVLTSRQPMFVWWGDSLINLYNDAYKSIVGGKHPDALGQPASTVWREIWDQVGPRAAAAMHGNQGTYDEALLLIMERYGYEEETYYTFSYSPVPNDDGTTGGLICANTDDTARVIGERQLATLRELAARGVDAHNIEEACSRAAAILAVNPRDLPFAAIYLLDPGTRVMSLAGVTGAEAGSDAAPATVEWSDPDGPFAASMCTHEMQVVSDLRPFGVLPSGAWPKPPREMAFVPILASGPTGRAGVLVVGLNPFRKLDDTYRAFLGLVAGQMSASIGSAVAYDEEKQRVAALAEIDRAKTAFFSNVSHEFRTPLTLMLGPTEDALASPERALRDADLETVHRNELRLLKLVNALLDFSRIEAGRVQASYEATDLSALTSDLASSFRSAVERAGLAFEVDCPGLPEPVYVDHDMWEKTVLNLLSNALKFTFEGHIAVGLHGRGDRAELTVSDTGVGIAERELPRLFERFHRIEGTRARTHEGSGIGLALVRDLVGLHGGSIEVASQPGEGTTFTVAIPYGAAHLPPERIGAARSLSSTSAGAAYVEEALRWTSPAPSQGETPAAESEKSQARILVADDNTDMRDYIARILRRHWTVECVSDGVEALQAVRQRRPDLLLSDVMMPRMDGFSLVRELRGDAHTATMPIILLSARAGEEATAAGLRTGADDYLVKPFSASALVVRVEAQLAAARLRETLRRNAEAERERLEVMFREAPAGIGVLRGPTFVVEVANPVLLDLWGRSDSIVGQPLLAALPELAGQGFDDHLRTVVKTGVPHRGKDALVKLDRRGNGLLEEVYIDFVFVPLHTPEGRVDSVFVHAYDVTDKVSAVRHAEQLRLDAVRAVRTREDLLAIVSHDLRNPLSTVLMGATHIERIADDSDAGLRTKKAASSIVRAADRMSRLIGDLLDLAKLEAGQPLPLELATHDMVELTQQAAELHEPLARSRQLTLRTDLAGPLYVLCDSDRVQQVLANLIGNAIKFTREGGLIEIAAKVTDGETVVSVRDTGTGIPDHQIPHIFEPYWQADAQRKGSAGLGLSIAKAIVDAHGGRIWVETSPGLGSTFSFTVSAAEAPHTPGLVGAGHG